MTSLDDDEAALLNQIARLAKRLLETYDCWHSTIRPDQPGGDDALRKLFHLLRGRLADALYAATLRSFFDRELFTP